MTLLHVTEKRWTDLVERRPLETGSVEVSRPRWVEYIGISGVGLCVCCVGVVCVWGGVVRVCVEW